MPATCFSSVIPLPRPGASSCGVGPSRTSTRPTIALVWQTSDVLKGTAHIPTRLPKLIRLLIGTNNLTSDQTAPGVAEIIWLLRKALADIHLPRRRRRRPSFLV